MPNSFKRTGVVGVSIISLMAAAIIGRETIYKADFEIAEQLKQYPHSNLLERVTHYTQSPTDSIEYLKRNNLTPNLLIEWTQAGISMFDWPKAKVFMDGRAQQVYDEATYVKYIQIIAEYGMYPSEAQAREAALASLESAGEVAPKVSPRPRVDAVLLRMGRAMPLFNALKENREWVLVFYSAKSALFLRRECGAFEEVGRLVAGGREWRPDTPEALLCLGFVNLASKPQNLEGGLAAAKAAVSRDPALATAGVKLLYFCYRQLGRVDEGVVYFEELRSRFENPVTGMSDAERKNFVMGLQNFIDALKKQTTSAPGNK